MNTSNPFDELFETLIYKKEGNPLNKIATFNENKTLKHCWSSDFKVNEKTKNLEFETLVAGLPEGQICLKIIPDQNMMGVIYVDKSEAATSEVDYKNYLLYSCEIDSKEWDLPNTETNLLNGILKISVPARKYDEFMFQVTRGKK